jgi:hypothetical protein
MSLKFTDKMEHTSMCLDLLLWKFMVLYKANNVEGVNGGESGHEWLPCLSSPIELFIRRQMQGKTDSNYH